jgi:type I restriction enzyme S subunit
LKQAILQLAVMGKLVPQDSNDEPAAVLLKKIAAEKARLVKEGKIKKEKALPPVAEGEKPFEVPEGWEWVVLQQISVIGTGATPARDNQEYYQPAEFSWVTSGETSQDFICETREKISSKAVADTNVTIYPAGTLVIAMYGQGKTRGQIAELRIPAGTNQACAAIQLIENSDHHRNFIKRFFQKAYDDIRSLAEGGAQPNLNVGKVAGTVIPIPPLAEQHRIVTKVDELMALCDQLKARLTAAQTTRVKLADAVAAGVLV